MTKSFNYKTLTILSGLLSTFLIISLGLILTINWRSLYYHDINQLEISEDSGYSKETIRENYDTLIDYCSPFYQDELNFPSLPSSKEATQHFAEVKTIFVAFYYILGISFLCLIPIWIYFIKRKEYQFLKVSALTSIILPTIVGIACAVNFDRAFLLFHKLFFRNNYWLFDPVTDPIIELLPSEFFMHCAIAIVTFVLLISLIEYLLYRILKRKGNILK